MKLCWQIAIAVVLLTEVSPGLGWAASKTTAPVADALAGFDRNTTLGLELTQRPGTPAELAEIRALGERGLKAARDMAAANPKNADAKYALGSWLIYGYRTVETEETTVDASGQERTTKVIKVEQVLTDDVQEGLDALQQAAELAPSSAQYALDYGAALLDTGYPDQAVGALKTAWARTPPMTAAEKMRAATMLSDALVAQNRLVEAREWLYSALLVIPENLEMVRRLRLLDAADAAPVALPAAPAASAPESPTEAQPEGGAGAQEEAAPGGSETSPEEYAPSAPEGQQEAAPEEQGSSESGEAAPGGETSGSGQVAPDTSQPGLDEIAPGNADSGSEESGGSNGPGVQEPGGTGGEDTGA
jgi:tetratricopeptide (TPR) repeat protein